MPAPACYSNIPNGLMGVLAGSTLSNTGYSGGIPVDFSPSQGIGECRQCKGDTHVWFSGPTGGRVWAWYPETKTRCELCVYAQSLRIALGQPSVILETIRLATMHGLVLYRTTGGLPIDIRQAYNAGLKDHNGWLNTQRGSLGLPAYWYGGQQDIPELHTAGGTMQGRFKTLAPKIIASDPHDVEQVAMCRAKRDAHMRKLLGF